MRDEFEDEYGYAEDDSHPGWRVLLVDRIVAWTGAIVAVLVVVGLGLWGYRLSQRDITAVPVIHAALSPAKIQPADPGGEEPAHQGMRSYSAGIGDAEPGEIRTAAPPERPAEEDVAMGALQEPADGGADGGADGQATVGPDAASGGDADPGAAALVGDGTELAPVASPTAPTRPSDLSERMAAAAQTESAEQELASRAAASAVQIQLGAHPSRDFTKAEWKRIYTANEDILTGRALVVQSTISGGRRFFRLRAGPFKDRVEAQTVCRALQARGQDCLVAVNG